MIPKTCFSGGILNSKEKWMIAKTQFSSAITNVTGEQPSPDLLQMFEDTVPVPVTGVSSFDTQPPRPSADFRRARNEFLKARASKKAKKSHDRDSYADTANPRVATYNRSQHHRPGVEGGTMTARRHQIVGPPISPGQSPGNSKQSRKDRDRDVTPQKLVDKFHEKLAQKRL